MVCDEPDQLLVQAGRCRRLAASITDEQARRGLTRLAEEYEARAEQSLLGRRGPSAG